MPKFQGVLDDAAIEVPNDVVHTLRSPTKRPKVRVTINTIESRTTLMVYGAKTYIGLRRETREQMGIATGESVEVSVELDTDERSVDLPIELEQVLSSDEQARHAFEALSFTHRREYVHWLTSAKRADTRQDRLGKVAELLKSGRRTPLGR